MESVAVNQLRSADAMQPGHTVVGLRALASEFVAQGAPVEALFSRTGVAEAQLGDPNARISRLQRIAIYRNAARLAPRPDIGLLAGARQRVSDFGMYGYRMLSSRTFGDALQFSLEHVQLAGPVLDISYHVEGDTSVLCSRGTEQLGDLLPFVAEFWRSSIAALFGRVLEAPFPSRLMVLTYRAPAHWRRYEEVFGCPVEFGASTMEWHFDSGILDRPCPDANANTMQLCQQLCEHSQYESLKAPDLVRQIQSLCLNASAGLPSAAEMAEKLGMSLRTLHRRLAALQSSYQGILDEMRRSLAIEYLTSTDYSVEQIAERIGFADSASFRKSFKRWTGSVPTHYREQEL